MSLWFGHSLGFFPHMYHTINIRLAYQVGKPSATARALPQTLGYTPANSFRHADKPLARLYRLNRSPLQTLRLSTLALLRTLQQFTRACNAPLNNPTAHSLKPSDGSCLSTFAFHEFGSECEKAPLKTDSPLWTNLGLRWLRRNKSSFSYM